MDAIDCKIVALVSAHGRLSHEEIARRVHLSRPAVHERVKRLEADGIILGYRAVVDWQSIGLGLCGFVSVQIRHEMIRDSLPRLLELSVPQALVEECHRVTGEWCALLKVRAASPAALQDLLDSIHAVAGVGPLKTTVVLTSMDAQAVRPPA
jgi:Lrp/AsnC family transcriptional regulator, leucine-responsive regulatory protein